MYVLFRVQSVSLLQAAMQRGKSRNIIYRKQFSQAHALTHSLPTEKPKRRKYLPVTLFALIGLYEVFE